MGGAVSAGATNDELIDNLHEAGYIKKPAVERVFRAVDRADYYVKEFRESAYKDIAWKHGNLHLSAPCIYAEVLESLQIEPGMSFLNLGSGTGYLSTLVGLLIGPYGVNHGIEVHADVITYARRRLDAFRLQNTSFDAFEFSEPTFCHGNCLLAVAAGGRRYDRVYCGAACPPQHGHYVKSLVKVGGILVMPMEDQLLQIHRVSETEWESNNMLPVSFASLLQPSKNNLADIIELPGVSLHSLQDICRLEIRRILRKFINEENPNLTPQSRKEKLLAPGTTASSRTNFPPSHRGGPGSRPRRRVNVMPMSMGMMIMSQFQDSDSEEEEEEHEEHEEDRHWGDGILREERGETRGGLSCRFRRFRARGTGEEAAEDRRMVRVDDDHNNGDDDERPPHGDREEEEAEPPVTGRVQQGQGRLSMLQNMLHHYSLLQRRRYLRVRAQRRGEINDDADADADADEEDVVVEEDLEELQEEEMNQHKEDDDDEEDSATDQGFEDATENVAEMKLDLAKPDPETPPCKHKETTEEQASSAIPITNGESRKRYASNSYSYTSSGIGTCSSVEEQIDYSREMSREEPVLEEIPEPLKVNAASNGAAQTSEQNGGMDPASNGVPATDDARYKRARASPPMPLPEIRSVMCDDESTEMIEDLEDSEVASRDQTEGDRRRAQEDRNDSAENQPMEDDDEQQQQEEELPQRRAGNILNFHDNDDSDDLVSDSTDDSESGSDIDVEEEEEQVVSVITSGFSMHMHKKIDALPVPTSIKQYLMFYRT